MNTQPTISNSTLDCRTPQSEPEISKSYSGPQVFLEVSDGSSSEQVLQGPRPTASVARRESPSSYWSSCLRSVGGIIKMMKFKAIIVAQLLCLIYIIIFTFSKCSLRDPKTGYIIDPDSEYRTQQGVILTHGTERAIVAVSPFQLMCLSLARMSAFFMYPTLVMVYLTKLRAVATFLAYTPVAIFMYSDLHAVHVYCGWTIFVCSIVHCFFHILRWVAQNNLNLVLDHYSGVSGILIFSSLFLICLPMIFCKQSIRYEIRKNLHYFFLLFAFALCFHTSTSAIPNGGFTAWVFSILLSIYIIDNAIVHFLMTEKIETSAFRVLPSGVQLSMTVSDRFRKASPQGGYCYVCFPWISKYEWHAFSVFKNPSDSAVREIFILKAGDWTRKVHATLWQRNTVRPVWLQGPFTGPYSSKADAYDNQILVASGIGITPALSVINAYNSSRRVNLIWAVREKDILSFYLKHLCLDRDGWSLIFYTGKGSILSDNCQSMVSQNVCIIQGRPNLAYIIPNIIYGIESGQGLPRNDGNVNENSGWVKNSLAELTASWDDSYPDIFQTRKELSSNALESSLEFSFREFLKAGETSGRNESITGFQPWRPCKKAKSFVLSLDKEVVLETWGVLYCGGSKGIESNLRELTTKYQIAFHSESFAW